MLELRHANDSAVCKLYGAHAPGLGSQEPGQSTSAVGEHHNVDRPQPPARSAQEEQSSGGNEQQGGRRRLPGAVGQGPVVAFNLLRGCGSYVGYRWETPAYLSKPRLELAGKYTSLVLREMPATSSSFIKRAMRRLLLTAESALERTCRHVRSIPMSHCCCLCRQVGKVTYRPVVTCCSVTSVYH